VAARACEAENVSAHVAVPGRGGCVKRAAAEIKDDRRQPALAAGIIAIMATGEDGVAARARCGGDWRRRNDPAAFARRKFL